MGLNAHIFKILPIVFLSIAIEATVTVLIKHRRYHWKESLSSIGVAVGHRICETATIPMRLLVSSTKSSGEMVLGEP
jgi:hypothetical protein